MQLLLYAPPRQYYKAIIMYPLMNLLIILSNRIKIYAYDSHLSYIERAKLF